jgi:hypothetical protein
MSTSRCNRCGHDFGGYAIGSRHDYDIHGRRCGGTIVKAEPHERFDTIPAPAVEPTVADPKPKPAVPSCACGKENPYPQDGGNQPDGTWLCWECQHDPSRKFRFRAPK